MYGRPGYCGNCGAPIKENDRFCSACGADIEKMANGGLSTDYHPGSETYSNYGNNGSASSTRLNITLFLTVAWCAMSWVLAISFALSGDTVLFAMYFISGLIAVISAYLQYKKEKFTLSLMLLPVSSILVIDLIFTPIGLIVCAILYTGRAGFKS